MTSTENQPIKQNNTQLWLDKLWQALFNGDHTSGLLSPGQIRRETRDRLAVRKIEMAAIVAAEQDVNCIQQGLKALDYQGNIIDTPRVDTVVTHSIIENMALDNQQDIGLDSCAHMIQAAARDVSVRNLEKALNLRKIAILAESHIYEAESNPVSQRSVSAEWLIGWKEAAQSTLNPELQLIFAKMLTQEVAHPGQFSLNCIHIVSHLNSDDIEMLRIMAKYITGGVIFNASDYYFKTDFHSRIFEQMNDIGLMSGFGLVPLIKQFNSSRHDCFELMLPIANKALRISHDSSSKILSLPAYPVSLACRQLLTVLAIEADLAYLFELAKAIKAQGFTVTLGDWHAKWNHQNTTQQPFIEKMKL